jgi:putative tricarboxylic transport membrane protein
VSRQLNPGRPTEARTPADASDDGPRTGVVDVQVDDETTVEVREPERPPGALLREVVPEAVFLLGAVYLFVVAGDFSGRRQPGELGPAFWPRIAAVGLAITLLVRIVQTIREHRRPVVHVVGEFDDLDGEATPMHWRSVAIAIGLAFGYVLATMFVGYLFATMAFLGAFAWLGGQRRWYTPVVAVVGGFVLAYVFVGVVYVSVPTGVGVFDSLTVAIYRLLGIQ